MTHSRVYSMQTLGASAPPPPVHFCWTWNQERFPTNGPGHSCSRFDVRIIVAKCLGSSLPRLLLLSGSAQSMLHRFLAAKDGFTRYSIGSYYRISRCAASSRFTNRYPLVIAIHWNHRRYYNSRHRGIVSAIQMMSELSPHIDIALLQSERIS